MQAGVAVGRFKTLKTPVDQDLGKTFTLSKLPIGLCTLILLTITVRVLTTGCTVSEADRLKI